MFLIKKFISSFLMPFPIFLLLVAIGFYFWQRGNQRRAKQFLISSLLWISLLSYSPFSALLLLPLESAYTKAELTNTPAKYIHVLGSGHVSNPDIPLSSEIGLISLARLNEGVSLYKTHENMKMIFSGYGGRDPVSNARKNSQMAIALGVNPKDIILLEKPQDTQEEAIAAKKIIGNQPLILVTSASHMVRALALFRKEGIEVIPAPTDFQAKGNDTLWQFPSADGLGRCEAAFHEYLGLGWGRLKGYL
ncbi:MAG: ElyC/SanA/YdcF family protein [Sulfuricurvum sp.]|nr:ElyC/SanA/YdcF family protein [Sulfuricurvum sp.]